MKISLLTPLAVVALASSACSFHATTESSSTTPKEPPASSTVVTSALWPSMSAQSDGKNLTVYAALISHGTFLSVGGTDVLTASLAGGPELVLELQPGGDPQEPHYIATALSPMAATDVVVRLRRAGGEVDEIDMHVPAAFDLDGVLPQSLKRGTPMTVHLLQTPPAGAQLAILLTGPCIEDYSSGIFSPAVVSGNAITIDTSLVTQKQGAPSSCQVTVKVQSSLGGGFGGAFDTSSFSASELVGIQERRFNAQWSSVP